MKYGHIIRRFARTPWAIEESKLADMTEFLELAASGVKLTAEEIQSRITPARERKTAEASGSIAILPVVGIVSQRGGNMEDISAPMGVSTERLSGQLRALVADSSVKAIILDVDSPGGSVEGVEELANEIFNARSQKPIVAVANSWAASAAYWIASSADELVVTPSGEVGSIGVYAAHVDETKFLEMEGFTATLIKAGKFKAETHPWIPLSDEARASIQKDVDFFYGMFVNAVARNRNVDAETVRNGFGEGRMVTAAAAVKLGMADKVATLRETVERFGGPVRSQRAKQAANHRSRQVRLIEIQ